MYISESVVYGNVYKQMWLGPARAPVNVVATEFKKTGKLIITVQLFYFKTRKIRANVFCHVHVCV